MIPYATIQDAVLYSLGGLLGGSVLRITAGGTTYQFGLNPWVRLERHLPFRFRSERVAMRRSAFSVTLRIAVAAVILYEVWRLWLSS